MTGKSHQQVRDEMQAELEFVQKVGKAIAETNGNPIARQKARALINKGLVPCGLLFRDTDGTYVGLTVDGRVMWYHGYPHPAGDE